MMFLNASVLKVSSCLTVVKLKREVVFCPGNDSIHRKQRHGSTPSQSWQQMAVMLNLTPGKEHPVDTDRGWDDPRAGLEVSGHLPPLP